MPLPADAKDRKRIPIYSGVLKYFPDAIIEVAKVSFVGNEQHNPGQPLHWAREKSQDHEDCIVRHSLDAMQAKDRDERIAHMAARAWRALAALQLEVEADVEETLPVVEVKNNIMLKTKAGYCSYCGVDLFEHNHLHGCIYRAS